ncbi:MAG TPA: MFS transporter [Candidatus Limnocylindria bacterium]
MSEDTARRRALITYFGAAALTSVAYIATFQNAAVLAPQVTGTASTGGLPSSSAVAGTALAAILLSSLMAARGRRAGIVAGIGLALVGSAITIAAVLAWSFALLLAGALLLGFGNAAINLSRYAAAELYPPARRASIVGLIVWGSTLGAVAGPNLVGPANGLAEALGLERFAGGFALAMIFLLAANALAVLGPRAPVATADASPGADGQVQPAGRTPMRAMVGELLATTRGRTAVAALVSGQLVMVLIMTMTPYHLDHTGHGDEVIGLVLSAHTFGMFALSPVSGRLTERFGGRSVIMAGFALLALSGLLGAATPDRGGVALMLPLFLLGFGWNCTFVAGSSLLASGDAYRDRARLQGVIDAAIWGTAAVSGVVAGFVVASAGFAVLCIAGAALAVLLAAAIAADNILSPAAPEARTDTGT